MQERSRRQVLIFRVLPDDQPVKAGGQTRKDQKDQQKGNDDSDEQRDAHFGDHHRGGEDPEGCEAEHKDCSGGHDRVNGALVGCLQGLLYISGLSAFPVEVAEHNAVVDGRTHQNALDHDQGKIISGSAVCAED